MIMNTNKMRFLRTDCPKTDLFEGLRISILSLSVSKNSGFCYVTKNRVCKQTCCNLERVGRILHVWCVSKMIWLFTHRVTSTVLAQIRAKVNHFPHRCNSSCSCINRTINDVSTHYKTTSLSLCQGQERGNLGKVKEKFFLFYSALNIAIFYFLQNTKALIPEYTFIL